MSTLSYEGTTEATYDLTNTTSQYLNVHLVSPMIQFLMDQNIYDRKDLLEAQISVLQKTSLKNKLGEVYQELHGKDASPPGIEEEKEVVLERLKELNLKCQSIFKILNDDEKYKELEREKNFNIKYLSETHEGITESTVNDLFEYAQLNFDCGRYPIAADMLYFVSLLSNDDSIKFKAYWGKFAAKILIPDMEGALEDLKQLKIEIDRKKFEKSGELGQNRAWLLHWSLFVYFNYSEGLEHLTDLFFDNRYFSIISTKNDYLLRYVVTAMVLNRKKKSQLVTLAKFMNQLEFQVIKKDPLLTFFYYLFVELDFENASVALKEFEKVLKVDCFLNKVEDKLRETLRELFFELFSKIHTKISMDKVATLLNIKSDDIEKWIINTVSSVKFSSKIDSENRLISINKQIPNNFQRIIEKTENFYSRTNTLKNNTLKYSSN